VVSTALLGSPRGKRSLSEALGLWKQAQATVEERFGHGRLQGLHGELSRLTEIVRA